jgi:uncharacterized protein YkwD
MRSTPDATRAKRCLGILSAALFVETAASREDAEELRPYPQNVCTRLVGWHRPQRERRARSRRPFRDGERRHAVTQGRTATAVFAAVVVFALVAGSGLAAGAVLSVPGGLATSHPRVVPGAEDRLFALLNRARRDAHEAQLVMDPRLRSTARALSQDMARHGFLGHVSSSGRTLLERLSAEARPGAMVGENVGFVHTIEEANQAFLSSAAHRTVMLYPAFRYVGIGVTTAGSGELVITEDFAQ